MRYKYSNKIVKEEAEYILAKKCTYVECSAHFGIPRSTIGYHMLKRLKKVDAKAYSEIRKLARENSRGKNLCRN